LKSTSKKNEQVSDSSALRLLLIDENTQRSELVASALDNSIYKIMHIANSDANLLKQVDQLQPDIIVIDVESPNRDILESLHTIKNYNPKPVVMFSGEQDTHKINQSIESGVSAYVVGGIDPSRVKPILDAAVARFKEYQKLKTELSETKHQLASRKVIDQAKRLLMKYKNLDEDQAFRTIRKTSMDTGQKLEDVAKTIVSMLNSLA
jgi:response regulator NasT